MPAYEPPAWLLEGIAVVKQANPAADCERRYPTGFTAVHDSSTCSFESRLVRGATAQGRCGMNLVIVLGSSTLLEPFTFCEFYFGGPGAINVKSPLCTRNSTNEPHTWRGGNLADPLTIQLEPYADLATCLDAQRPGSPGDAASPPPRTSAEPVQKAGPTVDINVTCAAGCTATATGNLTVGRAAASRSLKLKTANKTIAAGTSATMKLRVPKRVRKAAKTALKQGRKVKAKLAITIVDAAGTRTVKRRTVKLRL